MASTRTVRVFVSSTFRDVMAERDELMTHTWPELRRFCRERQVELVEVDLRWGISEEQSTRGETLKLCLDEIRACRPFFVGLLGERYGWVPGDDAFTADLAEEQSWLRDLHGKSVTELEILHGVLNNPEMAGRSFFYFRDPAYAQGRGADFLSENAAAADLQTALKTTIRRTCAEKNIPLHENYPDPVALAALVLEDLKAAIEDQYPIEEVPDPLTREANDHEAFAETRRRTYIGRTEYFEALDGHAAGDGGPLVLLGDSGSGKSALLANWIGHWRQDHPEDIIVQHYIGGTPDSADHWRLMTRLIAEIRRWTDDPEELPSSHDDIVKTFPVWLAKARIRAERNGVQCIIVLDALNQLEDVDHARLLGWLPAHPFTGPLRLIVSALPGDTLTAVEQHAWPSLRVQPLTTEERRRMIVDYLARFSKHLDAPRLDRLAAAPAAANPLYLKILLDELRVTGTYDRLDERLGEYLAAPDIPVLLRTVLGRYQRDYERDRPGLVGEALGLIWAARRGLGESELLQLLRPADLPQLPLATWAPLRAALEEGLVDRGGILNFAHDFLRAAVETAFVPGQDERDELRLRLADYFEAQAVTARSCDELPWLLWQTGSRDRLRACLLGIERFLEILKRDEDELRRYWVWLGEERTMGNPYLTSFETWSGEPDREDTSLANASNALGLFLHTAALHTEAEPLYRRALAIREQCLGADHPKVATPLNNLAQLLMATNRLEEAEPLIWRALAIDEQNLGADHPAVAPDLNSLAQLLQATNRQAEAEPLFRRALAIFEQSFGTDHPEVARALNNLATLLQATNQLAEAEPLYRRALAIFELSFGTDHPEVATALNNLAQLLQATNRLAEAEPLYRRALAIDEQSFGPDHPNVATHLDHLAQLLQATNRLADAEPLMRRALAIDEQSLRADHPAVAVRLNTLALLLQATNRLAEAEPLYRRALAIDEQSFGPDHPNVATHLDHLAQLLQATNRLAEAEPLMRRALAINEQGFGPDHPNVAGSLNNLAQLLQATNRLAEAEPLMHRSLAIFEQSFGPDHPNIAVCLYCLAQLFTATNRLAEAEPLMRRVLVIDEQNFGADHSKVAIDLNNLAGLLKATNRLAEAEPLYRRALAIDEQSFGPDHPNVAIDLNNLAQLLQATNQLAEAEPLMHRALAISDQSFGADHPEVATTLNNLALLLQATNRLAEAEPLYRRALAIDEQSFGTDHSKVAIDLNNLAGLLKATNRLAEAESLYRRALAIDEQSIGTDHPEAAQFLNNLAMLLQATNRLAEAEPLMRRHLAIFLDFTRSTGHPHPHLNDALQNYGGLLLKMGLSLEQANTKLIELGREYGILLGGG